MILGCRNFNHCGVLIVANSLKELLARRAELEAQISTAQREERASAISQVKSLMVEYGLSMADIHAVPGKSKAGMKTGKVAVKYRDKAGNTWTGRGLQPKWLRAAIADGHKQSDFVV